MPHTLGRQRLRRLTVVLLVGALLAGCTRTTATKTTCSGAIGWEQANQHIGESTTVEGPVISTHFASGSNGRPTFLNVGKDYPDSGRFTVVIWGENRNSFPTPPEEAYAGKTICVTGSVDTYQGIPEIVARDPEAIQVVG